MTTPTIGLERLPRQLRRLLDEAADNTASAAAVFHEAAVNRQPRHVEDLEQAELNGDRITHDLTHELRRTRLSAAERGRLFALAQAVDDTIDCLEDAGREALRCECGEHGDTIAAIIRDLARAQAEALHLLGARSETSPASTASDLTMEARRALRQALAEALRDGREPLRALEQRTCLQQFERCLDATRRAVELIDRTRVAAD